MQVLHKTTTKMGGGDEGRRDHWCRHLTSNHMFNAIVHVGCTRRVAAVMVMMGYLYTGAGRLNGENIDKNESPGEHYLSKIRSQR